MRLKGKVAVVTGGSSGIGQATSILFAEEGASVSVVDMNKKGGQDTVDMVTKKGGKATFFPCDVTKEEEVVSAVRSIVNQYGKIDVLFNNAGIVFVKELEDTTVEEWDRVMAINAKGVFLWAKHVVPIMKKNGGGSIVNAGSISGLIGNYKMGAYCASKGAVVSMTRAMALDLAKYNIRVNATCPGSVETPLLESEVKQYGKTGAEADKEMIAVHPVGRIATPMEIAKGALFLACDDSSFITGSMLTIDGGYTAQ